MPPARAMRSTCDVELGRRLTALVLDAIDDRVAGALAQLLAVEVDAAHPRRRAERDELRVAARESSWLADPVLLLGEHDDRAALRRLVGERGELCSLGELRRRATPGIGTNSDA